MKNPTKDFYNKNAQKWAALKLNSFYHEKEFARFVAYFKDRDTILDIGCANGIHVPLFMGIGRKLKYEGIDISSAFLKMARVRYPQLSFKETDLLDRRTFPKKKYNGFWAAAVFMHIPVENWPAMLENVEGVMKPGAIGYITVPQEQFASKESDTRHFEFFDKARFKQVLGGRRWKVLKSGKKETTATNEWLWFFVQLPK